MTNRKNTKRARLHTIHVEDGHVVDVPDVPGLDPGNVPFMGEMMTCVMCGRQQKSDPLTQSQWRAIEADGVRYYACPAEFPPDTASSAAFQLAYNRVLARIVQRAKGAI